MTPDGEVFVPRIEKETNEGGEQKKESRDKRLENRELWQ
jgi:hypothetical protein